ncbi:MAG: acetyl-CoA carboxylase biotin carboxyl carrier protein [Alkalispirochaeta sp.]
MNLDEIITLIDSFNESSLTELKLDQDGTKLTLKRTSETNPVYTQPIMVHPQQMQAGAPMMVDPQSAAGGIGGGAQPAAAVSGSGREPGGDAAGETDTDSSGIEVITSPIVGTVYRAPSPDSPPFCQDGDVVEKGNPICVLEAMKVMNELEAEFSMEIVSFKVNNGEMVEYGTPLVEVRRV